VAPDQSAFEFFAGAMPNSALKMEQRAALLSAVAGSHMRSLAVARDILMQHTAPSVPSVLNLIQSRLGTKLGPGVLLCARDYVISCIASATRSAVPDDLEANSDKAGAIPPVLMCLAFKIDLTIKSLDHPILRLLDAFSLFTDPFKQLEVASKAYDFFLQRLRLLVVPGKANFHDSSPDARFKSETWYRALKFPESMKESSCSLLKSQKVEATTKEKEHYQNVCT
jgi:hypothetical protein